MWIAVCLLGSTIYHDEYIIGGRASLCEAMIGEIEADRAAEQSE
jgi:hypothetical protein